MRQFDRSVSIRVGNKIIQGLHMDFEVTKTSDSNPNTAVIGIFNLSIESANQIAIDKNPVVIDAGYESNHSIVFSGFLRELSRQREGADILTIIEAGDGDKAFSNASSNIVHPNNTSLHTILKQLVKTIPDTTLGDISTVNDINFNRPYVAIGDTVSRLDALSSRFGFDWSIQSGVFVAVSKLESISSITKLSPSTGLLGIPVIEKDGDIDITSLLNPRIQPHHLIEIEGIGSSLKLDNGLYTSKNHRVAEGLFKVDEMKHNGSNYQNAFYTNVTKARRISSERART